MILGDGICTVFSKADVSGKGEKPRYRYDRKTQSYFAALEYETGSKWTTQGREDVTIDARIRIMQDKAITTSDVVVLDDVESAEDAERYEIDRIYHGRDDESGALISDVSLRRVRKA